jgi:hypothetical protein
VIAVSMRRNDGRLVFALDDAYIHMAIAKHFALNGVWGVTPFAFSSSSSSPLWTLALSGVFRLLGPVDWAPLAMNVLAFTGVLCLLHAAALSESVPAAGEAAGLVALPLLLPTVALTLSGMEHLAQLLADLALVWAVARVLARKGSPAKVWPAVAIGLLAAAVTGLRYEGLFLVAGASVLLAIRRKYAFLSSVAMGGAIPTVAYGAVSVGKGWLFLPNSVVLKGNIDAILPGISIAERFMIQWAAAMRNVSRAPFLPVTVAVLVLLAVLLRHGRGRQGEAGSPPAAFWFAVLAAFAAVLQTVSASAGYFFRYEAYLVGLAIAAILISCPHLTVALQSRQRRALAVPTAAVAGLLVALLVSQGYRAAVTTVTATANIYSQQIQMAMFVRDHCSGSVVVANDVGAIDYYADIRLLDVFGLADMEVARFRLSGEIRDADVALEQLARRRNAVLGILYVSWLEPYGGIPASWRPLGTWTIDDNVVCGSDTVTFFGIDAAADEDLLTALREHSARLPAGAHAFMAERR